jgi:hypothetical protein
MSSELKKSAVASIVCRHIGLRYLLCFGCAPFLWTKVDQLKAQTDALGPFLRERNVVFEL